MANYIILGNFTDQGIRNVKETTERADAVRSMAEKIGATIKDIYWTLGSYDIVAVLEAPDDEAATALGLSIGSLGNVRTQTLRAFTAEEIGQILTKTV